MLPGVSEVCAKAPSVKTKKVLQGNVESYTGLARVNSPMKKFTALHFSRAFTSKLSSLRISWRLSSNSVYGMFIWPKANDPSCNRDRSVTRPKVWNTFAKSGALGPVAANFHPGIPKEIPRKRVTPKGSDWTAKNLTSPFGCFWAILKECWCSKSAPNCL